MIDKAPYINLLRKLVSIPSLSREEDKTAVVLSDFLQEHGVSVERIGNNIIARYKAKKDDVSNENRRPVVLLNSHQDTVKPSQSYTRDPFDSGTDSDRIWGLGSNDAGGCLVSLIATFLNFKDTELPFDLVLAISAEEECSGTGGMRMMLPHIGKVDMGIVGEPTSLQVAVGERGLLVLDCVAHGRSGHAARNEGENALYKALDDIQILRNFPFEKQSETLGPIGINVTVINSGTLHNVIPDECRFTVDVRTTDAYTNVETVELIRRKLTSDVTPRSTHLNASAIDSSHPLVKAATSAGSKPFLSPTMSDMALLPFPTIKIGPGESSRSHTADEYILTSEIEDGIEKYISLIENLSREMKTNNN